jgi:acetoacetyl-CoA synthetase
MTDRPLWRPDRERVARSKMTAFSAAAATVRAGDYPRLHDWSVREPEAFWRAVWDACSVIGERGSRAAIDLDRMPGARFFPDARLSFPENLLRRRDDGPAIIARSEAGGQRVLSWKGLHEAVCRAAAALRTSGVAAGDRVCGIVSNVPEAVVVALGAAAIGAVWSSCSPDFGVQGILDRFGQIDPAVLLSMDGYQYGGRRFDCTRKLSHVVERLPGLRRVVVIPFAGGDLPADRIPSGIEWDAWLAEGAGPAEFERLPFNHPLYVLFSSGTTGAPKCIVHGAGGTLIQHLKEQQLHCDVRSGDRVFYFTTCGWMMWNWLVSNLASEATIVLYDGSPFHPDGNRLFDLADDVGVTLFGTSAKFIDAVKKAGLRPATTHRLESLRTITSTGSPLAPESFDFVYEHIKANVHLASISGGTDIVSCFVLGDPTRPVWRGEIQCAALGMDVAVFGPAGDPLPEGTGELVCRTPFPSMPIGFWNDPDGARYRAAYFERFPGVWCHGDWIRATEHGGFVISGRSDATLNPGGVRIGTAEIYRQVEQLPEVAESLAVGQEWDGDERIVLFVRLVPGAVLDDELRLRITGRIRANTTPRHVPARIVQVADIPRTKSGKIVELAVRDVIHGRAVKNVEALANPEALEFYRSLPDLRS